MRSFLLGQKTASEGCSAFNIPFKVERFNPIPYPVCDGIRSATGTSVIRTGIVPSDDMNFTLSIDVRGTGAGWKVMFGSTFVATADGQRAILSQKASNYLSAYLSVDLPNNLRADSAFASTGGVCVLGLSQTSDSFSISINDVEVASADKKYSSWTNQETTSDICILNQNNRSIPSTSGGFVGIMKSFVISRGGAEILNCVPVVAPNGKGAFYDTVSNRLLEDFNEGGDVAPVYI